MAIWIGGYGFDPMDMPTYSLAEIKSMCSTFFDTGDHAGFNILCEVICEERRRYPPAAIIEVYNWFSVVADRLGV